MNQKENLHRLSALPISWNFTDPGRAYAAEFTDYFYDSTRQLIDLTTTEIDTSKGFVHHMAYSPIAKSLAFSHRDRIYTISLNGHDVREAYKAKHRIHWFQWHPNGQKLMTLYGLSTKWQHIEANVWQQKQLFSAGALNLSLFQNDGSSKRFSGNFMLVAIEPKAGQSQRLYTKREDALTIYPSLSPDGKFIVLSTNALNSPRKVFLVSAETGDELQLTRTGMSKYPVWRP